MTEQHHEDERVKRLLAEVRQDIAETSPNSSPMGVFRQHCEDLLQVIDGLLPVQPAASTPTERATLDALVQMRHHNEHRQFNAATCPAWPCDVIREIRAAASTEAQDGLYSAGDVYKDTASFFSPMIENPTTTPSWLTEQTRQLVDKMYQEGCDWHGPTIQATCDHFHRQRFIERIASFAAEAATQGQIAGIERAAELAEKSHPQPCTCTTCLIHAETALAIRRLSPLPGYLDRVRNEAAQQAAVQNGLEWAKKVDQGLIEHVARLKQNEEGYLTRIVELQRERDEAATAALEQAAQLAETMALGETFDTGRQKAINIAAAIRTMKTDAAIGDDSNDD